MKQITLIFITFLFLISCDTQQKELGSTDLDKRTPTTNYIYAEDLFYLGLSTQIFYLEQLADELFNQYEDGNESIYEQYLETEQTLETLNRYYDVILEINRPRRPSGVIPFPPPTPLPCLDESSEEFAGLNCQPTQDFTNIEEIVSDGFGEIRIRFEKKDQIVGRNVAFGEDIFGQRTTLLETDFEGEAIMFSTVKFDKLQKITIITPVYID